MTRAWRGSLGLLLMSTSTSFALSRLIEHGLRPGIIAPMVVAMVVADRGVALAMRVRMPMLPALVVGALLSFVALVVGIDPTVLSPGSAHFFDPHFVANQFHAAQYALANDGTPLPSLDGVVMAIGALGSLAAAATRSIWESQIRRGRGPQGHVGPLTGCIAPSLGVFVYSTLVSADHGRAPAAVVYFAGAAAFVALSDRASLDVRSPRRSWHLPVGAVASSLAVLAVLLLANTGLSSLRLSVFHVTPTSNGQLGSQTGQSSSPLHLLTGTALVDNLRSVLVSQSNTVIFDAHSAVPTYWQVGTLTSFDGTQWIPGPEVQAALAGASHVKAASLGPVALPIPASGRTFGADLDIADFASRLLPAPPHTVAVRGLPGAVTVGQEGVLAENSSQAGTTYSVTAQLPPTKPASNAQLDLSDPRLAPYLALPTEPIVVSFLAHEAVGQAPTQGAQVQALVNWFRSGKFRYTLDPPSVAGSDPLVQFLTVTHAGFCQQFAGAFGIMARSLGIPTRLVVGFISGQPGANNSYTVTGADAHVWPQVYLGPGTGWVSVEPTPPAANDTTAPAGVVGPNAAGSTAPTTVPAGGNQTTTTTTVAGSTTPSPHRGSASGRGGSGGPPWLLIALALVAAGGIALALLWKRRHLGGFGAESMPPDQRIVRAWERAQRALQRRGLGRTAAETPGEYAVRLDQFERRSARLIGARAIQELVDLVELACYTPMPCTAGHADAARSHASAVVDANRRVR